ncbi:hypothetical protein ml_175 [Mollivirus sibericum]|uniref:hypothetical protein n=1 Tax=Mollivirus sibericum TaxID=1678078 RepID=UPI0006B2EE16|nr:hypothetical protein ml_175 [Mollivirus sibericum]ALD61977.1 hypothetical protein ml_175 [Mollivirus sibericum]
MDDSDHTEEEDYDDFWGDGGSRSVKSRRLGCTSADVANRERKRIEKEEEKVNIYVVTKIRHLGRVPRDLIGYPVDPISGSVVLPERFAQARDGWDDLHLRSSFSPDQAIELWSVLDFLSADRSLMDKCEKALGGKYRYGKPENVVRHAALYLRHGPRRIPKPAECDFTLERLVSVLSHGGLKDMADYDIMEAVAYSICELGACRTKHVENMCLMDDIEYEHGDQTEEWFVEQLKSRFPGTLDLVMKHLCSRVVLAGGSVADVLVHESKRPSAKDSDLDVFVLEFDFIKYLDIILELAESMAVEYVDYEPTRTTLHGKHTVQVVLVDYRTAEELVNSFDMAHVAAAYSPGHLKATWGCVYATRRMFTWPTSPRPLREDRIDKARRKGFRVIGRDVILEEADWGLVTTTQHNHPRRRHCPAYFCKTGNPERMPFSDLVAFAERIPRTLAQFSKHSSSSSAAISEDATPQ